MRLTIPHRFDFGADRPGDDLADPAAWDALRLGGAAGFAMPKDRGGYAALLASRRDLVERAEAINATLDAAGARSVASYGVGGATLEYAMLETVPERRIVVGEYAPATVTRLRELLPELDARQHDLLCDPPFAADVHLMHRIDTEFTGRQWHAILEKFVHQTVLFVASEPITWRTLVAQARVRIRMRQTSKAGWVRTRDAQAALVKTSHDAVPVAVGDHAAWMLQPHARPTSSPQR